MAHRKKYRLLSNRFIRAVLALLISIAIRLWGRSLRIRFFLDDTASMPQNLPSHGIYIFWHEFLLLLTYTHARVFTALTSMSRDGGLVAGVLHHLGGKVVRGSSSRGRTSAFRAIVDEVKVSNVGVAVDGPRGPARIVPVGIVRAASFSGKPIVPVGVAYGHSLRIGPRGRHVAWPRLCTRAWVVVGRPVHVPRAAREDREDNLKAVQAAMDDVQARAEAFVAAGKSDMRAYTLKEVLTMKPTNQNSASAAEVQT
ncbi:MAG: lysophospholipid acyltransferase family protein [Phycisphaerae bacterium]